MVYIIHMPDCSIIKRFDIDLTCQKWAPEETRWSLAIEWELTRSGKGAVCDTDRYNIAEKDNALHAKHNTI